MISCMNKTIIASLMLLVPLLLSAQGTRYYRLVKKVHNDVQSTNVSGGQFITFIDDICYESDKKGIGVGHGTLTRNENYSTSTIKTYIGSSYWGKDAVFKFTSDLSVLNVVTEDGDVYLYKCTTAPANVTTCSLIRKNSSSGTTSGGYSSGAVVNVPSQPIYNGSSTTTTMPIKTTPEKKTPVKVWHECSLCRGKRTIVRESSVSTFGQDTQWYCNQCGRNVWRSSGHSHVTCSQCQGQGGYYTTQ